MRDHSKKARAGNLEGGGVERKIEAIKSGFDKAAGSYRKRIDAQISDCFELANDLWKAKDDCDDVLDGDFKRHIQRRPEKGEALRFVLSKVRSDAKEASLYYRATVSLFEKGVTSSNLTKAVTKAGGYRALASKHVKFPRVPKLQNEEIESDGSDASSDDRTETKNKSVQPIDTIVKSLKGTEVLHCKFSRNGRDMTKYEVGSWFGVCGHVVGVVEGRPIIEFFEQTFFE